MYESQVGMSLILYVLSTLMFYNLYYYIRVAYTAERSRVLDLGEELRGITECHKMEGKSIDVTVGAFEQAQAYVTDVLSAQRSPGGSLFIIILATVTFFGLGLRSLTLAGVLLDLEGDFGDVVLNLRISLDVIWILSVMGASVKFIFDRSNLKKFRRGSHDLSDQMKVLRHIRQQFSSENATKI